MKKFIQINVDTGIIVMQADESIKVGVYIANIRATTINLLQNYKFNTTQTYRFHVSKNSTNSSLISNNTTENKTDENGDVIIISNETDYELTAYIKSID